MGCARGKASPNSNTRVRLFADSAGYCQNPGCGRELFVETSAGEAVHIAEMAHIFAASDAGPRGDAELSEAERGSYENLILLCANCHTIIDKAPADFPDDLIKRWKRDRVDALMALFGAHHLDCRASVREAIAPLLGANKVTLDRYGPNSESAFDPESDAPEVWRRKVLGVIIPNNKRILAILDQNRDHATPDELVAIEELRQHTDDLSARHLEGHIGGARFPTALNGMMCGNG